jgi:hypothetical protein
LKYLLPLDSHVECAISVGRHDRDNSLVPGIFQADDLTFTVNGILCGGRQNGEEQQPKELHGSRCYQKTRTSWLTYLSAWAMACSASGAITA